MVGGAQMSNEQFNTLISTIRSLAPKDTDEGTKSKGSFGNYNLRFSGQRDPDAVEEFIHAVETYKEVEQISDNDALRGLSLLFTGDAQQWWKGVRRQAKTWQEAMVMLRENFAPAKPIYQIYAEIFEEKQSSGQALDEFICKKRALLAKLPEGLHDEDTELNFIYGLLSAKYRDHIPRHEVKSFRDLLEKGRQLERSGQIR